MALKRNIELLKEPFQSKVITLLDKMNKDEVLKSFGVTKILVSETLREESTQLCYFMRGRVINPADVKMAYKRFIGWEPSDEECRTKITWTVNSKHMEGLAVDLVPSKDGTNFWWAPVESPVWARMGELARAEGISWGGDWKDSKDCPHFEVQV